MPELNRTGLPADCPEPGKLYRFKLTYVCMCLSASPEPTNGWRAIFEHPTLGRLEVNNQNIQAMHLTPLIDLE